MYKSNIVQGWEKGRVREVDLRSDTVTLPSQAMKEAMFSAPLGDDVFKDDPTVNLLEQKMAEMSGKEAALFVPSGTMGNLIAVMTHCWNRGAEVLIGDRSHIHFYEQGGVAQVGGVHPRTLINRSDGTFCLEEMESKVREDDPHLPVTSLVAIENSHNKCGGRVLPLGWLGELSTTCRRLNLPIHCDGARIFNSCVSQGVELRDLLQGVDSASICLSKGLGCPVGSVIVGSSAFTTRAIRVRKLLGGGLRQSGVLAAAGLYALDHMIDRLHEDHQNAQLMAVAINEVGANRFRVDVAGVETNIVIMWVDPAIATPAKVIAQLAEGDVNVRALQFTADQVRFVFHCMVDREDTEVAIGKVVAVIEALLLNK